MSHKLKTSYSENKMLLKRSLVVCFELSSLFPTVCYNNIFLLSTTLWPESQNKCQGPKGEQGKGKNKKLLLQSRVALYWRPQAFPFFLFSVSAAFSPWLLVFSFGFDLLCLYLLSEQWHHCCFLHWPVFCLFTVFHIPAFLIFLGFFFYFVCFPGKSKEIRRQSYAFSSSFTRVAAWLLDEELKFTSSYS